MARLDPTGVSRILTYIKTWITGLLSNKSDSSHTHSDYVPKSGGEVLAGTPFSRTVSNTELRFDGGAGWTNGASIALRGKDKSADGGSLILHAQDANGNTDVILYPNGSMTKNDGTLKHFAMREDVIPRSGGAVITSNSIGRENNIGNLDICGGISFENGAFIALRGKDSNITDQKGFALIGANNSTASSVMQLQPNGTWTWSGTAVQITSDQRLKQQISNIDDKLLDAWEDVLPCQFKYNDAVEQKGDTARLHTGYVVQQIDEACKSHNLDISAYGLYCHEEYSERTEEVTIENEDGTTSKETKVVEPAKEYYSLRYTEALIVECAYLRREVKRLSERLEKLEK